MTTVDVKGRRIEVGEAVANAMTLIANEFNGKLFHDNGQAEGPLLAYRFPGGEEIAVRLNKRKLTLYLREHTPDKQSLRDIVPGLIIEEVYDGKSGNPVHSIKNGRIPYLLPADGNRVLRIAPEPSLLRTVLEAATARPPAKAPVPTAERKTSDSASLASRGRALSPEELLAQMDRRSTWGVRGENVAMAYEIERLHACGCADPKRYVEHVALSDVAQGYDIASTWPGQERYIEVKTSSVSALDFFISVKEREVLKLYGPLAWIYRVELNPEDLAVVKTIQDPMRVIPESHFTPQVWRVRMP